VVDQTARHLAEVKVLESVSCQRIPTLREGPSRDERHEEIESGIGTDHNIR